MKRTFLLLAWALLPVFIFSQTSLVGKVTDAETKDPVIFGTVALFKNKVLITGTETDFQGKYALTELEPGVYDVVFSYTGFQDMKITGVAVVADTATTLNAKLTVPYRYNCGYSHHDHWHRPLISRDELTQGFKFSAQEIGRISH